MNKPREPIKLALIGASNIAGKVLPSIRKIQNIEIHAVAAKREGAAKQFAAANKIPWAFDSYERCFQDKDIDAVYISTLNSNHAALIERALQMNKHVMCEKPLVLTEADAKRLTKLAQQNNLILLEGFMYRFQPQVRKMKEAVDQGKLGIIKSIQVNFSFLLYDLLHRPLRASGKASGGALTDIGCYGIDFINFILGTTEQPEDIQVFRVFDPKDPQFDLSTIAILFYKNGLRAEIRCSIETPALNNWEVSGTKGSISALRYDPQGTDPVPVYFINEDSIPELTHCPAVDAFKDEFQNFSDSIQGLSSPHITHAEIVANAKTLEAIRSQSR